MAAWGVSVQGKGVAALKRHAAALSILLAVVVSCLAFYATTSDEGEGGGAEAPGSGVRVLHRAERLEAGGVIAIVGLPDTASRGPGESGPLRRDYRWQLRPGASAHDLALHWPGLIAHARIVLNGHVLMDTLNEASQPLPRSLDRIVLLPVPDDHWQSGDNLLTLQAAAPRSLSVSVLAFGPREVLAREHRARVIGVVVAPGVVAAVVGTLGLCMLLLWSRLGGPLYGYFGAGSVGWALNNAWSVVPWRALGGQHWLAWWLALYTFFVCMLVIFCVRFAGWHWRRFELALWLVALAAPVVLYGAAVAGELGLVGELWRLGLIGLVCIAVTAIVSALLKRRSTDNLLIALTGLVCLVFALHDWIVMKAGHDNNPVYWVPFAGLLFVAVMVRVLIDRLVRATRQLEGMNTELESRVATQHAELREALRTMQSARDSAEAADLAKTRFLAAASHDLRQPAHALGLYMAALRAEPLDDNQAELVQRMSGSLAALDTMFNALLDVSRMDAGGVVPQRHPFALAPMLRRLADEFAPQAEARGLRLSLRLPAATAQATALSDELLVERILRNLLANAVKYTSHGGVLLACRLREAACTTPPQGGPTGAAAAEGSAEPHWRIDVWDTGPGIAAADREKIFEEFFQVGNPGRDRAGGLGLGLSIVRRLTGLLQLPLALFSRAGRGSCFALSLPQHLAAPADADPAPLTGPEPLPGRSLAGLCVVMIEDDGEVRDAMRLLLARWGCELVEGGDAAEVALQWQRRPRGERGLPDAIVADYRLAAGRTGPAEVQVLWERWRARVPTLVVTGESTPQTLRDIAAAGLACLEKPLLPTRLREWLETVRPTAEAPHPTSRAGGGTAGLRETPGDTP